MQGRRHPQMHRCKQFKIIYSDVKYFALMRYGLGQASLLQGIVGAIDRLLRQGNGETIDHERHGSAERGRGDRGRYAGAGRATSETGQGDRRASRMVRAGPPPRPGMERHRRLAVPGGSDPKRWTAAAPRACPVVGMAQTTCGAPDVGGGASPRCDFARDPERNGHIARAAQNPGARA